tara:strand:- start:244 stop:510 length:267 start_codon:yes stop_codon:yes gene_type:complete
MYIRANTKIKAISESVEDMFLIPPDSLSRLFVVIALSVVEMMNLFAALDPLIKIFIQVALVIGPLCLVGVILILKKIEKDNPGRIRWK